MEDVTAVALASLDVDAVREIEDLVRRVARATGHPALGEPKRLELAHVGAGPVADTVEGSTGLLVRGTRRGGLVGYAQVGHGRRPGEFITELVLDAGANGRVADALVEAAIATATEDGRRPATLRWWIPKATGSEDERATSHGFTLERDLVQMRCALPVVSPTGSDTGVPTRPFRPGVDEEAWLAANNRAFADHPEQGQWDLATLREREREPWFDPDGFRVLEAEGRMAGSCWTKIHRDADPPLGEIYVIGVDPDFQGRGFGRASDPRGTGLAERERPVGRDALRRRGEFHGASPLPHDRFPRRSCRSGVRRRTSAHPAPPTRPAPPTHPAGDDQRVSGR